MEPKSKPLNILFLFPDQHRYDWLGKTGIGDIRTPHIDALANGGVHFTNGTIVPCPLCAPMRACLASGKRYDRCGVPDNRFNYPERQPTFYQSLRAAGYEVAGVGKFDLSKKGKDWGIDGSRRLDEWGFTKGMDCEGRTDGVKVGAIEPKGPYMAYLHRLGLADLHVKDFEKRRAFNGHCTDPTPLPEEAYCDNWIGRNALDLLSDLPKDKPWFLQVNFVGPHPPLDITKSMHESVQERQLPIPIGVDSPKHEEINRVRQNYTAMVENIDRMVGQLIDALRARGEMENTVIVYSSDHGEMAGDHNRFHKHIYYRKSISVPLIMAGPGIPKGMTTPALVESQDLAATFLEIAQAAPMKDTDSISLLPLLTEQTQKHRPYVISSLKDSYFHWTMVWDGRFKLVEEKDKPDRLFDLQEDPEEMQDVKDRFPQILQELKVELESS